MIRVNGLEKRFGEFRALGPVDLAINAGEFVVVLGPSGAGKSTMLHCINGLATPSAGEISVDGAAFSNNRRDLRLLRRKIAMIFQHHNLVKRLTVVKNVLVGRMAELSAWTTLFQLFPATDVKIALHCLEQVNLEHKAYVRASLLSGGEQQRVGIARALAQQPRIILADEPVASLDPKTSRVVLTYLKKICKESNITVLCNLHQIDFALEFGERIIGLSGGQVVYDGPPIGLGTEVIRRIYPGLDDPNVLDAAQRIHERRTRVAAVEPAREKEAEAWQ
jgi:phosphonate transport system ATP-binding protein